MSNLNCCNSLINQSQSLIGQPLCVNSCPQDFGCDFWVNTGCIIFNGDNLSCLDIPSGTPLNILLKAIDTEICNLAPPSGNSSSCNVYASCTDPCPSALVNKVGSGTPPNPYVNNTLGTLNVSLSTNGITNCQTVDVQEKPWTFNQLILIGGATQINTGGYSNAGYLVRQNYPTITNLLEVKLQGGLTFNLLNGYFFLSTICNSLPASVSPITTKVFNVTALINNDAIICQLSIYPTGIIKLNAVQINSGICSGECTSYSGQVTLFLDGLNYIKN